MLGCAPEMVPPTQQPCEAVVAVRLTKDGFEMGGAGGPDAPGNRARAGRWWLTFVRGAGEDGWNILRVGKFSTQSLASQMRALLFKFKMETSKRREERKASLTSGNR